MVQGVTPEEAEAIQLVWESRGNAGKPIPEEEEEAILAEVRARVQAIEAHVLTVGIRTMSEGRKTARRHQRVAYSLLAVAFIAAVIVLIVRSA